MELLVVISIIATLMAFLFPLISGIRRNVYAYRCMNNLRQIGLALRMYENDYGRLPSTIECAVPLYSRAPSDILVCPWVRLNVPSEILRKWEERAKEHKGCHWSSYFYFHQESLDYLYLQGHAHISYSQILQIRGDATPIVYCREHREPFITMGIPYANWFFPEAPIVLLRRNGSVELSFKGGTKRTGISTFIDALTL